MKAVGSVSTMDYTTESEPILAMQSIVVAVSCLDLPWNYLVRETLLCNLCCYVRLEVNSSKLQLSNSNPPII
jgi:hypothetical protein